MEDLIKQVSYADWAEFRRKVIERCGFTSNQFGNRMSGRTPLSASERVIMQAIIDELNKS